MIVNPGNSSALLVLDLNTTLAAVVSSVAVLLLSSIFFYFVGFICGCRCQKQAKSVGIKNTHNQQQSEEQPTLVPVYEELQSTSDQVKAFELNENVAYGPTPWFRTVADNYYVHRMKTSHHNLVQQHDTVQSTSYHVLCVYINQQLNPNHQNMNNCNNYYCTNNNLDLSTHLTHYFVVNKSDNISIQS